MDRVFEYFPKLPAEIRIRIWRCAAGHFTKPPVLTRNLCEPEIENSPFWTSKPPTILLVNREGRAEAGKLFTKATIGRGDFPIIIFLAQGVQDMIIDYYPRRKRDFEAVKNNAYTTRSYSHQSIAEKFFVPPKDDHLLNMLCGNPTRGIKHVIQVQPMVDGMLDDDRQRTFMLFSMAFPDLEAITLLSPPGSASYKWLLENGCWMSDKVWTEETSTKYTAKYADAAFAVHEEK